MKPITRKSTRLSDGARTGWSLSAGDYERAVAAMTKAIETEMYWCGTPPTCVRAALKAIGIVAPKNAKGASSRWCPRTNRTNNDQPRTP